MTIITTKFFLHIWTFYAKNKSFVPLIETIITAGNQFEEQQCLRPREFLTLLCINYSLLEINFFQMLSVQLHVQFVELREMKKVFEFCIITNFLLIKYSRTKRHLDIKFDFIRTQKLAFGIINLRKLISRIWIFIPYQNAS